VRGGDMSVTESGIRDAVRQVLLPLWNVWYFYSLYANAEGYQATLGSAAGLNSDNPLDRYAMAKTAELVAAVTAQLDVNDLSGACASVRSFLDALTNWYIRRSRDRFWAGDHAAFETLATVLEVLTRVMAPLAPLTAEEVWRGLTGGRSVHLTDWPVAAEYPADPELVAAMDAVRDVCSAALSLRKLRGLRVRLPLPALTVATADAQALRPFVDLIADEVNVKEVVLTEDSSVHCHRVLTLIPRALGPRLGGAVQQVIRAVKAGDWSVAGDAASGGVVTAGGVELRVGEYELSLVATDPDRSASLPGRDGVVVLDTVLTPELVAEGVARDVVRVIQLARRDADLSVSDRITVRVEASAELGAAITTYRDFVGRETLATEVVLGEVGPAGFQGESGEGEQVRVTVARV